MVGGGGNLGEVTAEIVIRRIRRQREVRLRTRGFESVAVRVPSLAAERELGDFYARPGRANTFAFVNELLAGCVEPPHCAAGFAALPESERAQLRLAVVAVCELQRSWRALHGSHLTPDERLFAVMLWHHQDQLAQLAQLARKLGGGHQDLFGAKSILGTDLTRLVSGPSSLFGLADSAKLYSNELAHATKMASLFTRTKSLLGEAMYAPRPTWQIERALSASLGTASIQKAVAAMYPKRNLAALLGFDPARLDGLLTGFQMPKMPTFQIPDFDAVLRGYLEPFRDSLAMADEVDSFIARVDGRLMFLISNVSFGVIYRLRVLKGDEVEAALLTALEMVVLDAEFVPMLRAAIAQAPYLNEQQRIDLDHALEHAGEGDYARAKSPLYHGLEGALWEAAVAMAVITRERRLLGNPKKEVGFETAVKALGLEPDFQTFLVLGMFGSTGNPYRHGSAAPGGVRRQVLFGVAAIAGWLDAFAGLPALDALAGRIAEALLEAVERVQAGESGLTPQLVAARPTPLLTAGADDEASV